MSGIAAGSPDSSTLRGMLPSKRRHGERGCVDAQSHGIPMQADIGAADNHMGPGIPDMLASF